jgi:hypothetical protein
LINLAARGVNPNKLIDGMVKEIREGAGPYHIGSTVRINQPWAGSAIGGGSVSLNKGDVVSIVQANLGEQGQDKMILLSDGKTRAIVPLKVLGEKILEQDPTKEGPSDFMNDAPVPGPSGAIDGTQQGDGTTPEDAERPEKTGQGSPASLQGGDAQGQPEPGQDPAAQVVTGDTKTAAAVAVEAVHRKLESMLSKSGPSLYKRINEVSRKLRSARSLGAYAEVYEMLFGDKPHTVTQMESLFEETPGEEEFPTDAALDTMGPEEIKTCIRSFRKKYQDASGSTATQTGVVDQSEVLPEGEDDPSVPSDDEIETMSDKDLRRCMRRLRGKYQSAMGMTGEPERAQATFGQDVDEPPADDAFGGVGDEPPPADDVFGGDDDDEGDMQDVAGSDIGMTGDETPSQDVMDPTALQRRRNQDQYSVTGEPRKDQGAFGQDDPEEEPPADDQFTSMTPPQRRKYIRRTRTKYRGKYAGRATEAKKAITKYGAGHARRGGQK